MGGPQALGNMLHGTALLKFAWVFTGSAIGLALAAKTGHHRIAGTPTHSEAA